VRNLKQGQPLMGSASDSTNTDRLLQRVADGQTSALDELMGDYRQYLRRLVELRIDPELRLRVDASDVVQETQLAASERIDDFLARRPISFRLWLRGTALERLISLHRRHVHAQKRSLKREVALTDQSSLLLARRLFHDRPSQALQQQELLDQVRRIVSELSEPDREILLLRHVEELTNSEVADLLAIERSAASRRYGRAVIRLRNKLVEHGISRSE
jgi:RNA polymerase sigma-70 factor (ECF subfamily)